jgi:hypothetical protein
MAYNRPTHFIRQATKDRSDQIKHIFLEATGNEPEELRLFLIVNVCLLRSAHSAEIGSERAFSESPVSLEALLRSRSFVQQGFTNKGGLEGGSVEVAESGARKQSFINKLRRSTQ